MGYKQDAVTRIKLAGPGNALPALNQMSAILEPTQPVCVGYSAPQTDTDMSGDLIAKIQCHESGDCCSLCQARSDCEGFVFHLDQCYLKKNLTGMSYKQDAITRLK